MFKTLTTIACLSLVGAIGATAAVPKVCGSRDQLVSILETFGEFRIAGGLSSLQPELRMFEVFVNPSTDRWTVLKTDPLGQACIVDHGHGYRADGDNAPRSLSPAPTEIMI